MEEKDQGCTVKEVDGVNKNEIKTKALPPEVKYRQKMYKMKNSRNKNKPKSQIDILDLASRMIVEMQKDEIEILSDIEKHTILKKKFSKLHKNKIEIYMEILHGNIKTEEDLNMLKLMLDQAELIRKKRQSEKQTTVKMGQFLFDKYVTGPT